MSTDELCRVWLYLNLVIEASVVAKPLVGDPALTSLVGAAACAAADHLGISDEMLEEMQRDKAAELEPRFSG